MQQSWSISFGWNTVVIADQALRDISYELWEQASPDDDIGILLSCV